jgi:hypothetical protein
MNMVELEPTRPQYSCYDRMAMKLAVRVRYRRVGRVGGIESLISKREFIVVDALDLDYLASSVFGGT